jgi:tRNA (guanosine-2'-O-)-methyltransferase
MISLRRLARIKKVAESRQQGIIVLENISDPHNAAAVLRTADAFGFQKVYFIFEKGKKFNLKKIGKVSSASANKWLDFEVFTSTKQCFSKLKRQGYTIVATVLDAKAKSIFITKFTNPKIALCFGNEHAGLSSKAIELSDTHIYIPMQGFVQSLNLSVTVAICMYEMSRQRKPKEKNFLLNKQQQNHLVKSWKKQ